MQTENQSHPFKIATLFLVFDFGFCLDFCFSVKLLRFALDWIEHEHSKSYKYTGYTVILTPLVS